MKRSMIIILAVVMALMFGDLTYAAVVPAGLNPGDSYHLVFVTQSTRDASDFNIGPYNTFVQNQAALNSALTGTDDGVTYRAIGSTENVDARDNALVESPVYLLDGTTLIATGFADMWNSSIVNPIILDQFATAVTTFNVFTGTDGNGYGVIEDELGNGEAFSSAAGRANQSNLQWINMDSPTKDGQGHFYALSEKLTVVPEPATLALLLMGGLALLRRKRVG